MTTTPKSHNDDQAPAEPASLPDLQQSIAPLIDSLRQGDMDEGLFGCLLKASFAKSFDSCKVLGSPEHESIAFLLAPVLRGTCEDLIVLRALRDAAEPVRQACLYARVRRDMHSAIESQSKFFKQERPFQPVFDKADLWGDVRSLREDERRAWKELGYDVSRRDRPSTMHLAEKNGLEPLYRYVYALTSDVVHFNPRVLLRTGWSNSERTPYFSTEHFSRYYAAFSLFYSHYLLGKMYDCFSINVDAAGEYKSIFGRLQFWLDGWLRWPEVVTFEELNIKEPGAILRIALKAAHARKGVSSED